MSDADWIRTAASLASVVGSLIAYFIGKGQRSGSDRTAMKALQRDVEELKRARIEQTATLAAHTAMHDGYVHTMGALSETMAKVSKDLSYIRGRLDTLRTGTVFRIGNGDADA